ncbi:aldo/keto reductase [Paroceanicella profunda]|uniref:Aldo/keto reductase n=1 Tax=Paroceanicella profunda TaxID=2579971 RepID=A0A5B8FHJ2_9RHOB|nr:aldo/keto reductase [Paroceanicella profunda]QDL92078.1 aldo/keto reductase [Paroceanicella profunda]
MEKRPLGRSGLEVSVLGLGTMMFHTQLDRAAAWAQMDRCLDVGCDFFDTAEIYPIPPAAEYVGRSEEFIGDWMAERGTRTRILLATKVAGRNDDNTWIRPGRTPRVSSRDILEAVEGSLRRLKTDVIDLYQIHWPDRQSPRFANDRHGFVPFDDDWVPLEEAVSAMGQLIAAGKIRSWGLSNDTPWGTMKCIALAEAMGVDRPVSVQNPYSLLNRIYENGLAEVGMMEDVGLLTYSPLAQGYLSGKYLDGKVPAGARKSFMGERMTRYEGASSEDAIRAYLGVAADFGLDPNAMALRWSVSKPWVASSIFGAANPEQLETVFASLKIDWTPELDAAVNAVHARWTNPAP